ncbi:MAG: hypothetical protein M3O35_13470 [Acidobacteriota bacterium]|nr:hypothetical protein [Acidobacteriota bacterium]
MTAVRLEVHPGSSLRDPTEKLVEIPAGAMIEVEGLASSSGLINVLWNGDAFSVFNEDLQEKARRIDTAAS